MSMSRQFRTPLTASFEGRLTYLASALLVFSELEKLSLMMDTQFDATGLALMDSELPVRIHTKRRHTPKAFWRSSSMHLFWTSPTLAIIIPM